MKSTCIVNRFVLCIVSEVCKTVKALKNLARKKKPRAKFMEFRNREIIS